jgi:hypothetical protein
MGAGPASSNGSKDTQVSGYEREINKQKEKRKKPLKIKPQKIKPLKIKPLKKKLKITPIKQVERLVSQLNIQKLENKILKKKKKKHFKNKVLIIQEEVLKIHLHQLLKFLDQVYLKHYKKMQ